MEGIEGKCARVLFVDDDDFTRRAFGRLLRRRGIDVDLAASAQDALQRARNQVYAVVVTDLRMPGVNGFELIQELASVRPEQRFILVSAVPDVGEEGELPSNANIAGVFSKPWDDGKLVAQIAELTGVHQPATGRSRQILVVDGLEDHASEVFEPLPSGFSVVHFRNPLHACEWLHDQQPHAILLNLSTCVPSVEETITQIQSTSPETPLLAYSRTEDEARGLQAIQLGAQDYLAPSDLNASNMQRSLRYAAERKRAESRLIKLAHYDSLTELANRSMFRERVNLAIARARRQQDRFAVMFLDLDNFKDINDQMGHAVGDRVLREVANRLRMATRETDTVARLGGDEFAVLVTDFTNLHVLRQIARRILASLQIAIELTSGRTLQITGSVGVSVYPDSGKTVDALLKQADKAMYDAKRRGKNTYHLLSKALVPGFPRLQLEKELRRGFNNREFVIHYQPQVDASTQQVQVFEALLRWRRKDGTLATPSEFLPMLEDTGLIIDVGEWVLREACQQLRQWRTLGAPQLRVAVNACAKQLGNRGFSNAIKASLLDNDLEPAALELEIAEDILMSESATMTHTLLELSKLGVTIALDDFGEGLSSLNHLHKFSVRTLKIAPTFTQASTKKRADSQLAAAIVQLGHKLGFEVVAEGVETQEQLDRLRLDGCDRVQGFLFGMPAATWTSDLGCAVMPQIPHAKVLS